MNGSRRQPFERREHADRRERDPPRRHRQAVLVCQDPQRLHRRVVVVERLAHAHEDDVEALVEHAELAQQDADLADDLACRQVADDAHAAGQAEGALHRAADLGRDAEGLRRGVGDEDRLDEVAVGELEEELRRAVGRTVPAWRPPACRPTLWRASLARSSRPRSVIALEVGHAAAVDPLEDLAAVEARAHPSPRDAVRSRRARARPRRRERLWSWGGSWRSGGSVILLWRIPARFRRVSALNCTARAW